MQEPIVNNELGRIYNQKAFAGHSEGEMNIYTPIHIYIHINVCIYTVCHQSAARCSIHHNSNTKHTELVQ
jgi:hypothetical protein